MDCRQAGDGEDGLRAAARARVEWLELPVGIPLPPIG